MASLRKSIWRYLRVLGKRIYRPVKPIVHPLLKKIKLVYVLMVLVGLGLVGSLWNGWMVTGNEKVSWWPWSAKSHAEMAITWFENGDEIKALEELELANRLILVKTEGVKFHLKRAEDKVREPERIRQEIESWEKVIEVGPDYLDVLLRLSLLNYQIYEDEKTKEYFDKAEYLDPGNEDVLKVKEIISFL